MWLDEWWVLGVGVGCRLSVVERWSGASLHSGGG